MISFIVFTRISFGYLINYDLKNVPSVVDHALHFLFDFFIRNLI